MKVVDLRTCKQIPKKYHYLIDWDATYYLGIEKDEHGYWVYLRQVLGEKGSMLVLHDPLKDIVWYLKDAHEQVQKNGKFFIEY